jgi:hypothetical protein
MRTEVRHKAVVTKTLTHSCGVMYSYSPTSTNQVDDMFDEHGGRVDNSFPTTIR